MTTILLTSVFGPFGVDDEYGRKENIMELFHNQVTREQGMFSPRIHHPSFGLHLLAENVEAGVKVLDFPSKKRFTQEIKKNYDYVGISFITPNFVKAQAMARLIRRFAPHSKIILGGHGTRIPNIETFIDCDHVCYGEGVKWLRGLLGEKVDNPIKHPVVESSLTHRILGLPMPPESAVLIPGVGCPNACRFCTTSHFFDRTYTPYLKTGDEIFATCRAIESKKGYTEFFVMDENFLKYKERAERLLELMEESGKSYRFGIFSSAETVREVGIEFMVRMGVFFIWLGVESKYEIYEKNKGVDFHALIEALRDAGIGVLASGILFAEHHDRKTLDEDIDFLISLKADFVQFMELGPLPRTPLYESYKRKKLLLEDVPYEEWHGQDKIWFRHKHFERDETKGILKRAFEKDFQVNGPSLLRYFETIARGALNLPDSPPFFAKRRRQQIKICRAYRPMLTWLRRFSPTKRMKEQAREVENKFEAVLGPLTVSDRAKSVAVLPFVIKEYLATMIGENAYQPPTVEMTYRLEETKLSLRDALSLPLSNQRQVALASVGVAAKN